MVYSSSKIITAIIPVRLSTDSLYDETARIARICQTLPREHFEVLIVDYGTGPARRAELAQVASENSASLVRYDDAEGKTFSVGHARDIGTQHAQTPVVIYHDIDFLMTRANYVRLVEEVELRNMTQNAYIFFALPGAYLTEDFTKKYLSLHAKDENSALADLLIHDGLMRMDKSVYSHMTYAISALVANRQLLLAVGGHDRSFVGHGAEDFDLYHRLSGYFTRGPRPQNYYTNKVGDNGITSYEGFRAFFALYGIDVFQRGLVMAHLHHPRRTDTGYVGTGNNQRIGAAMREHDAGTSYLPPIPDLTVKERTLALMRPGTSPVKALRHALPLFGPTDIIPEDAFADPDSLTDFVRSEGYSQVLFLNPYGNEHRLRLYRSIKEEGIRYVAYDRGALPDSWFFDRGGFLGESASYRPAAWDRPLEEAEEESVRASIAEMLASEKTLEANGPRRGPHHLRERLQIGDRKVIFVALQRPSDTATVHFSGPCIDAFHFNHWVEELANALDPRKYVVLVKKHPLETAKPHFSHAVFTPDDCNIFDLIDLAEKVVVINSGTGVIAAALGKPVICCGQAFYCHPGVAFAATSPADLVRLVRSNILPDEEKVLRFTHYLFNDFYSFGTSDYAIQQAADGSTRNIATRTVFSVIRGVTPQEVKLGNRVPGVSLDAPLFYSFGGRAGVKQPVRAQEQEKAAPSAPPKPSTTLAGARSAYWGSDKRLALDMYEALCRDNPGSPSAFREAAEVALELGEHAAALRHLRSAEKLAPTHPEIKRRIAEISTPFWKKPFTRQKAFPIPKA